MVIFFDKLTGQYVDKIAFNDRSYLETSLFSFQGYGDEISTEFRIDQSTGEVFIALGLISDSLSLLDSNITFYKALDDEFPEYTIWVFDEEIQI